MKTCRGCGQPKPLSEFYRHAAMADGHLNHCKACKRGQVKAHRADNVERFRTYDRHRAGQPHRVKAREAYQKTPEFAQAHGKACRRYRERHPLKRAAHEAVSNAIRDGRLIRPATCSIPGCSAKPEAHHFDYSRPLSVVWLCDEHHKSAHAADREIQRTTGNGPAGHSARNET